MEVAHLRKYQLSVLALCALIHHSEIYLFIYLNSLINRMLQRDPKRRASLEEIESHAWLQGVDPSPATKFSTPLVSHKNLSEEEHNSIIQRMVLGDIADREAIIE